MIDMIQSQAEKNIQNALKEVFGLVQGQGYCEWSVCLSDQGTSPLTVNADEEWLILTRPVSSSQGSEFDVHSVDIGFLLKAHSILKGGVKYVPGPNGQLFQRVDLPLDPGVNLTVRIAEAREGFLQTERGSVLEPASPESSLNIPQDDGPQDPADLCVDANWSHVERSPDRIAIQLPVSGSAYQAILEKQLEGQVRIASEFETQGSFPVVSQKALSGFLFKACGFFRMIRACIRQEEDLWVSSMEVSFGRWPHPVEVDRAVASLAVACQNCGREIRSLERESIADQYLGIRNEFPVSEKGNS